jgi:hypothetical protein
MEVLVNSKIFLFLVTLIFFANFVTAQENIDNDVENNEPIENTEKTNDDKQKIGMIFSFSGFNEFRLGMGIFFGSLGNDGGHHPFGTDFGLLFEYNFEDNIKYTRFYYHLTGGVSAMLLGGSMVIAYDNNDMSIGFAPEIGIGLSTLFKIFYRYNFYINNKFNSYEIVFHLCLYKR